LRLRRRDVIIRRISIPVSIPVGAFGAVNPKNLAVRLGVNLVGCRPRIDGKLTFGNWKPRSGNFVRLLRLALFVSGSSRLLNLRNSVRVRGIIKISRCLVVNLPIVGKPKPIAILWPSRSLALCSGLVLCNVIALCNVGARCTSACRVNVPSASAPLWPVLCLSPNAWRWAWLNLKPVACCVVTFGNCNSICRMPACCASLGCVFVTCFNLSGLSLIVCTVPNCCDASLKPAYKVVVTSCIAFLSKAISFWPVPVLTTCPAFGVVEGARGFSGFDGLCFTGNPKAFWIAGVN